MIEVTSNVDEFLTKVKRFKKISFKNLNKVTKNITYQLYASIIEDTPILTGRLVANWNFSVDTPNPKTTNYNAKNKWTKFPKSQRIHMQRLRGTINKAMNIFPDNPDENSVAIHKYYLTNGWDYVMDVEYGSSTNQSHAMVRKNIQKIANMSFDKVAMK